MRIVGRAYLGMLMLFLLAPAAVVAFDSINSATSFPSPFEHATLRWYAALADHPEFVQGFAVSTAVAIAAACCACIAGLLAAQAVRRMRPGPRTAWTTALMGPLLVPEIVAGLAVLQLVQIVGGPLGYGVLIGTHAAFVLPVATRLLLSGMARLDPALDDAARSMGAGPVRAAWLVTLPLLRPSVIAALVMSAVLSFVNLPLSMFLTTPRTATLPVVAFAYMESRIDPVIAAVATLVMVAALAVALLLDRVLKVRLG